MLNIWEKVLGSLRIAVMMLIVQKEMTMFGMGTGFETFGFLAVMVTLLLNFFGWKLYFCEQQSVGIILTFFVVMPPFYYTFIGLWPRNWPLLALGISFLLCISHISTAILKLEISYNP